MLVGLSTQLLVNLCEVKGVVHFGIAGNANPDLQIGDVTIPQCWAQTGLWYGQVFLLPPYRDGPDDELSLESNGDHTRKIWYLNFSDYNSVSSEEKSSGNTLNSVWYQPEEAFPVNGVPETRQHAFWVSVGKHYHELSKKLEVMHPCSYARFTSADFSFQLITQNSLSSLLQ
ncbi:bark storage protein A-like [Musa troglodytarum]|uniref:Bark storage protein A-like n=1 Tax=Musa troglodytarum TaxID=320322 RepID=A0A9E7JVM9_9LILI|nr:bark storage protein A-like [Musa troglodytarum]